MRGVVGLHGKRQSGTGEREGGPQDAVSEIAREPGRYRATEESRERGGDEVRTLALRVRGRGTVERRPSEEEDRDRREMQEREAANCREADQTTTRSRCGGNALR